MALVLALLLCLLLPNAAMAARQFNGSSDYLVSASSLTLSGSPKLTIAFWLWWDAYANDDAAALAVGDETGNGWIYIDPNRSNGTFGAFFSNSSPAASLLVSFTRPSAATWHHYVFSIDRSLSGTSQVVGVWVDGATPAGLSIPSSDNLGASNWTNDVWYLMSFLGSSFFGAGRMDELVVYSGYNFVQADVDALFNRGLQKDARTVQTPTYYWQIAGSASPEPALVGGINMTVHGTTQVTHPYPTVSGSTVSAASCSQADVGAAIGAAFDGYTVSIPAGDCTWAGNITTSKRLLIHGAGDGAGTTRGCGSCTTIIRDALDPATLGSDAQIFTWSPPNTGLSSMSEIQWYGTGYQSVPTRTGPAGIIRVYGDEVLKTVRLHHMTFNVWGTAGMSTVGLFGLVDHNAFNLLAGGNGPANYSHGGGYGDNSWASPPTMGTDNALFFEDNDFLVNPFNSFQFANDGWKGARMVYRHNTYKNVQGANGHGTDSGGRERSFRHIESYENDITWESGQANLNTWSGFRGGTGVSFNNRVVVNAGTSLNHVADIAVFRAGASNHYDLFGRCGQYNVSLTNSSGSTVDATITNPDPDGNGTGYFSTGSAGGNNVWVKITGASVSGYNGTWPLVLPVPAGESFQFTISGSGLAGSSGVKQSPWDQNSDSAGYACLDQAGHGQGDLFAGTFDPAGGDSTKAVWPNQVLEPIYVWNNSLNGVNDPLLVGDGSDTLVENRDYYNMVKPGYTPFTYPHPLTGQGNPAPVSHLRWIFRHRP